MSLNSIETQQHAIHILLYTLISNAGLYGLATLTVVHSFFVCIFLHHHHHCHQQHFYVKGFLHTMYNVNVYRIDTIQNWKIFIGIVYNLKVLEHFHLFQFFFFQSTYCKWMSTGKISRNIFVNRLYMDPQTWTLF